MKKYHNRRLLKKILIISIIVTLLVVFLIPVRKNINKKIYQKKTEFIENIERIIGYKISYSSISPAILNVFELRNLKIYSPDNPEEYLIEIEQLKLNFSLFNLNFKTPLEAFSGLLIVNSKIKYNKERNEEILDLIEAITNNNDSQQELNIRLNPDFTIKGRNISLEFENDNVKTIIEKVFFTIKPTENSAFTISMRANSFFSFKNLPSNSFIDTLNINTQLRVKGRIKQNLEEFDLDIKILNLDSEIITVKKLGFNVAYNKKELIVIKTGDNIPFDLDFRADLYNDIFSLGLNCQDFVFDDYFLSKELKSMYMPFATASISGRADIEIKNNNIIYSGNLSVNDIKNLHKDFDTIDFSAKFQGNNKKINIESSKVEANSSQISFFGGIIFREKQFPLVDGLLKIPFLKYKGLNFSTELNIFSNYLDGYEIKTDNLKLNELSLKNIFVGINPYSDNLEYNFKANVFDNNIFSGNISSEGTVQLDDEYYIQSSVTVESLKISPVVENVQKKLRLWQVFRNFELSTVCFVSGTLQQLSFASTNVNFTDPNNEERKLTFSISGNNSGFRIGDMLLQWGSFRLQGRLTSKRTVSRALILDTKFKLNDVPINVSGISDNLGNISFDGDYGLKFYAHKTITKRRKFNLSMNNLPFLVFEKMKFNLSTNISGFVKKFDDWKVLIENITISSLETGYGSGNLNLSAEIKPTGGKIYKLNYSDQQTALSGEGEISLNSLTTHKIEKAFIVLSDDKTENNKNEKYELLLNIQNEIMYGFVNFRNVPLDRIKTNAGLSGEVDGYLNIDGSLYNPELKLEINTQNGKVWNNLLAVDFRMLYSEKVFSCQEMNVEYDKYKIENLSGSMKIENGEGQFSGRILSDVELVSLDSDFSCDIQTDDYTLSFSNFLFYFKNVLKDINAKMKINNIIFNNEKKSPWFLDFTKAGKDISFTGGVKKEIKGSYFNEGYFSLSAAAPFPLQLTASGNIYEDKIDIKVKNILYRANNFSFSNFSFFSGLLTGELDISGAINDPDFSGYIDVDDLVFSGPISQDKSLPTNGSFIFSGKSLSLPYTKVKTDNGAIGLKLDVIMERWLPRNYNVYINVDEDKAVSAKFLKSPFYSEGFVCGNMRIFGDLDNLNVEGDISCSNTVLMINSSLDFPSESISDLFFNVNLKVRVGENDEFYWPTKDVPILSGFLQHGNAVDIKYNSTDGLKIIGKLPLSGGEIFYFERNFYVKEGYVKFVDNAKEKIDPLLSARAVIREVSSKSEITKIYLIVDESPLSKFSPRFASDSQLSTSEIINILGGNIFGDTNRDNFDWKDAALLTSDVLSQLFVIRKIEEELKNLLHLDLLSIRSSFFSNFLDYNILNFSGTLENDMLSKYLDNTTLFLGKYITDEFFLQGTFEFDLYNNKGYSNNMRLNLDSEITMEWEAPIANFEFSLYPDFENPVEGMRKTSLGLSWHFTF